MSVDPIEPIGRLEFFFVVSASIVAGGVYIWPQAVIADAGVDAPWSVMLSILVAFVIIGLQTAWPAGLRGQTSFTRMQSVLGWGRWPVFVITLAIYLALDGALLALFGQLLKMMFYPYTPSWFFDFTALGLIGWLGGKSLTRIARNTQWWFPIIVASFFLLATLAIPNLHQIGAIRPSSILAVGPILKGMVSAWYLWIEGDVVVTVGIHVRDTTWLQVRRWVLAAVGFQSAILIIIYITVTGTLGPTMAQRLEWPMVYVFTAVTVPSAFISKPGILVIITWVIALILYQSVHIFSLSVNLQDGFSLPNSGRVVIVWCMVGILAVISSRLASPLMANDLALHWIDPTALALTVTTSTVLPVLVRWQRRRQNSPRSP